MHQTCRSRLERKREHGVQFEQETDRMLRDACEAADIPGVVAIAATGSEIIYHGAFGKRDVSKDQPMTEDSVFWLASMTKAITSAAAMQLVEQGRLTLDAPIGTVLPDLAAPHVLEGFDVDGAPKLRPARSTITLRHLLTHTSGFCYDIWNGNMVQYLENTGTPRPYTGKLAGLKLPLASDPGTRWEYAVGINFVGMAVEAVSGIGLDVYLRDHLFAPLGMIDTGFRIGPAQRSRLVSPHARVEDGSLVPIPFELEQNPEFQMGGAGLYSTAVDYIKFTQMILNKGRSGGHQLLKSETVALMSQNHIGMLDMSKIVSAIPAESNDVDFYPSMEKKWGLGFMINTAETAEGRSAGSLAWAGLANNYYWIDSSRDVTGVIMMQVLPFFDNKCLDVFSGFERHADAEGHRTDFGWTARIAQRRVPTVLRHVVGGAGRRARRSAASIVSFPSVCRSAVRDDPARGRSPVHKRWPASSSARRLIPKRPSAICMPSILPTSAEIAPPPGA
jgi:methyl acetate hydrolase